jgi:hypothetical protein
VRQACWAAVSKLDITLGVDLSRATIDHGEARQRQREALASKQLENEVDFNVLLVRLGPHTPDIRAFAEARHFLSPKSSTGLAKIASNPLACMRSEKNALKHLFDTIREAGFIFPSADSE